jgi:hypothetical protein
LPCLVLSCLVLPCLVLPCLALPCLVLSCLVLLLFKGRDGADTIAWIIQQEWSNGEVFMEGISAMGLATYAGGLEDPPALLAQFPRFVLALFAPTQQHTYPLERTLTLTLTLSLTLTLILTLTLCFLSRERESVCVSERVSE